MSEDYKGAVSGNDSLTYATGEDFLGVSQPPNDNPGVDISNISQDVGLQVDAMDGLQTAFDDGLMPAPLGNQDAPFDTSPQDDTGWLDSGEGTIEAAVNQSPLAEGSN